MIRLIYKIKPEEEEREVAWLREQKVFPAVTHRWDWTTEKEVVLIGVIVGQEAALTIKLRRPLDIQDEYKQR